MKRRPERNEARPNWRNFLTSTEAVDLEALEANAGDLDSRRRKITAELNLIRCRCIQRRRYAELHPEKAAA